jgi:CBS domain-containing protein
MLQIRDVMTRTVIVISPEHSLREAMELLASHHVSGAPVVSNGTVLGVVSATDLLEFAAALPPLESGNDEIEPEPTEEEDRVENVDDYDADETGKWFQRRWRSTDEGGAERFAESGTREWTALDEHVVSEVMTRKIVSLRPTLPLTAAADLMRRRHLHRVLVMERGELVGILSTSDIVRVVADGGLVRTRYVFQRGARAV